MCTFRLVLSSGERSGNFPIVLEDDGRPQSHDTLSNRPQVREAIAYILNGMLRIVGRIVIRNRYTQNEYRYGGLKMYYRISINSF